MYRTLDFAGPALLVNESSLTRVKIETSRVESNRADQESTNYEPRLFCSALAVRQCRWFLSCVLPRAALLCGHEHDRFVARQHKKAQQRSRDFVFPAVVSCATTLLWSESCPRSHRARAVATNHTYDTVCCGVAFKAVSFLFVWFTISDGPPTSKHQ